MVVTKTGEIADFLDAVYDAIGDLDTDKNGNVRWPVLVNIQREIGQKAQELRAAAPAKEPHKIEVDGPPCPTCGFRIRKGERAPLVFDCDEEVSQTGDYQKCAECNCTDGKCTWITSAGEER